MQWLNAAAPHPIIYWNHSHAKGFEFVLGWKDRISQDFTYSINGNLTTTETKVLNTLEDGYKVFYGPAIYKEGLPVGAFYGYIVDGLYQSYADILGSPASTIGDVAPGDFKYRDVNGDGKITSADRILYNPNPDWYGGFGSTFTYKNFQLDL